MVIAKSALENQLARLGFLIPPTELPVEFKKKFLSLWANSGDAISQQYAGTSALKGDYTRTGERNFAGIMKDGMKSANRFYLRFKDNYRQLAFEVLQGKRVTEEDAASSTAGSNSSGANLRSKASATSLSLSSSATRLQDEAKTALDDTSQQEREENIRQLVADCRKQIVNDSEDCYGSWALINYTDSMDTNQIDPDVVLIFTSDALYISNYDESSETFVDYQKILLRDVLKLELGPEPVSVGQQLFFKTPVVARFHILRIYFKPYSDAANNPAQAATTSPAGVNSESAVNELNYFHTFRSCNLRFFNNLVITTKEPEELSEALRGICHTIQSTSSYFGYHIAFEEAVKMIKKKSKSIQNAVRLSRLSTRMSIEEFDSATQPATTQQLNTKLNKFGKMLGNKLFGSKNKSASQLEAVAREPLATPASSQLGSALAAVCEARPPSMDVSASTKYFLSNKEKEESAADDGPTECASLAQPIVAAVAAAASTGECDRLQSDCLAASSCEQASAVAAGASDRSPTAAAVVNQPQSDSSEMKRNIVRQESNLSITNAAASSESASSPSAKQTYTPRLSEKQYTNRAQKLNDIKELFIRSSQTNFIFI